MDRRSAPGSAREDGPLRPSHASPGGNFTLARPGSTCTIPLSFIYESVGEIKSGARIVARRCAGTRSRADGCVDQNQKDLDLRDRRPHLEMGLVGAAHDSGADARGTRILRSRGSGRLGRDRRGSGRTRFRRRPHRLRPMPELPGGSPPLVPEHSRGRREPPRSVCPVSLHSLSQRLQGGPLHP